MRTQFTFYESVRASLKRIKKDADRAKAYDAICDYALYDIEPDLEKMPDAAAIAFISAKPNLDASKRKAESGKVGGSRKKSEANGKQTESKPKQSASEKESEKEKEGEKEKEDECPPKSPSSASDHGKLSDFEIQALGRYYSNRISLTLSSMAFDELIGFAQVMGVDCCKRAIDIALDERKTQWSYIRGILMNKQSAGVRCLADWDDLELKRKERKDGSGERIGTAEENAERKRNAGTWL